MEELKTAVELAFIAQGSIDAMNEKETTNQAREDIRTIARLFGIDAEQLWKDGISMWYSKAQEA